jgi:adenylate cyclase
MDPHPLNGLGRWLADSAPHHALDELFSAFCRKIVQRGLPVWRATLGLEVLHPEVSGWLHVWTDTALSVWQTERTGSVHSASYLNSPTRIVDETEAPFRRRLDAASPDLPILDELRQEGATDYVMFPLPFLDRSRTAVAAFATRREGGFPDAEIDQLHIAARLFSPYAERHVLRRIAVDLLDTYVGPRTGSRILEGRVDRGAVEPIEAAIWFVDMSGFTRLSEEVPIAEVIATLNAWFEIIGEVIEAEGGEILKFIGDSVLAIFPTGPGRDRAAACRQAFAAAEEFCRRIDAAERDPEARSRAFSLALHFGELAYGNVGAAHRLDFTVIGPAVNRASRLQEVAKRLGRRVILSRAFAQEIDRPLVDLGRHALRDVDNPQQVYAPA